MKKKEILHQLQMEINSLYDQLLLHIEQEGRELIFTIKGMERSKEIIEKSRSYQYGQIHLHEGRWFLAVSGMPGRALGVGDLKTELSKLSKEGYELVTYHDEKDWFWVRKEVWEVEKNES